jgi:hypothetical protein
MHARHAADQDGQRERGAKGNAVEEPWGTNAASCLKLGLRDEIDSVKEAKIVFSFPTLDYETASDRYGTPNPANRHDFPSPGRSFAPTNGPGRPAGREHEISQQSEQVIPRTDIPSPDLDRW